MKPIGRGVEDASNTPCIREYGGSDAETDHVSQGIELHAEFSVGSGQTSDAAIERIENNRDANGLCGLVEILGSAHQRSHDSVVSAQ